MSQQTSSARRCHWRSGSILHATAVRWAGARARRCLVGRADRRARQIGARSAACAWRIRSGARVAYAAGAGARAVGAGRGASTRSRAMPPHSRARWKSIEVVTRSSTCSVPRVAELKRSLAEWGRAFRERGRRDRVAGRRRVRPGRALGLGLGARRAVSQDAAGGRASARAGTRRPAAGLDPDVGDA